MGLLEPRISKLCAIMSVVQQIPKMALTVKSMSVTRFRTFNTPCQQKRDIQKRFLQPKIFFRFVVDAIPVLWNPAIRPPRYYNHFFVARPA